MKIGILLVGRASEDLVEKYGTYAEMLIALINSDEKVFEFETFNILDSVFPKNHLECDGWIVTGSPHGVYEEHSWIPPVSQLINDIYNANLPIFGVCFGHQLIAQALGGHVEKSIKCTKTHKTQCNAQGLNAMHKDTSNAIQCMAR